MRIDQPQAPEVEPSKAAALIMQGLDWVYDHVTSGAIDLAESYRKGCGGNREKGIDSLIAWHVRYAGAVGFATNVGGILTMPVTAPLNISSVIAIQLRMIAAIAHLRGYSIKNKKVKMMVFICLTGSGAATFLQELGISIGTRVTTRVIMRISATTLLNVKKSIGFRLLAKFGARGGANLIKVIPLFGGLVGGVFDAGMTFGIGRAAKKVFNPIREQTSKDTALDSIAPPKVSVEQEQHSAEPRNRRAKQPPDCQTPTHKASSLRYAAHAGTGVPAKTRIAENRDRRRRDNGGSVPTARSFRRSANPEMEVSMQSQ
jgi:uncharacterized protein (DUF697 family)